MTQEKPQSPIAKAHLEGVAQFDKLAKKKGIGGLARLFYKSFLTTYGINLLKSAKEAGPGKEIHEIHDDSTSNQDFCSVCRFNSCRSSFHSAIDEGIREIEGGK